MPCFDAEYHLLSTLHELVHPPVKEKGILFIKYCYEKEEDQVYLLVSNPAVTIRLFDFNQQSITQERLQSLIRLYQILHDERELMEFNQEEVWDELHGIFLSPVLSVIPTAFSGYIFVLIDLAISGTNHAPFINIPYLFDLSFFYADNADIDRLLFIHVSDQEPLRFVRKLFTAPLPKAPDMDILFGFPQEPNTLHGKFRKQAYQEGLQAAEKQGARTFIISDTKLFERLFSNACKGRVVQVLTHFHNERLYTPDLKYVRTAELKHLIDVMFTEDRLRKDITLHAATCNNFSSLKALYNSGIKHIYYSSNDLQTNEIAATFRELYLGQIAAKINCRFPYLDGKSFAFEAWTMATRCFYRNAFVENNNEYL